MWYKNKTSNTKVSIQNVSNHVTTIPIDLKDNNDPFTLHFRFHCYTRFVSFLPLFSYSATNIFVTDLSFPSFSCLSKVGDPRSLKLNYFLFFMPPVSTSPEILTLDSHFILSQTIIQPIRITANPGRDAKVYTGAISRKRPRSESGAFEKQNIKRERNSIDHQGENFIKLLSDFYFGTGSFELSDRE